MTRRPSPAGASSPGPAQFTVLFRGALHLVCRSFMLAGCDNVYVDEHILLIGERVDAQKELVYRVVYEARLSRMLCSVCMIIRV